MRHSTIRGTLLLATAGSLIGVGACGSDDRVVFVPGSGFNEELYVVASRAQVVRVGVGEPIVLSAQRRSGPWRAVAASDVEEGVCAVPSMPLELEAEVADVVTWHVRPEGEAVFNDEPRDDRTRAVHFESPGRYIVWAESASPCGDPFAGDTLLIEIVE